MPWYQTTISRFAEGHLVPAGGTFHSGATLTGATLTEVSGMPPLNSALVRRPQLRTRLTQIGQCGISPRSGVIDTPPITYLRIFTVEAPPRSVRVLFPGAVFNQSTTIVSCGAVGLPSLAPFITASWIAGTQTPVAAAGSPYSRVYFDHAGAFGTLTTDAINYTGSTTTLTIPAVTANTGGAPAAFTILASDVVPFVAVPRTDGYPGYIVAVLVTLSGTGFVDGATPNINTFTTDSVANRQRYLASGHAWVKGVDYSQDITAGGGGWTNFLLNPVLGLQYDTEYPGLQVMLAGDSGTCAPTTDEYSQPIRRAAWDLSTQACPIEVANLGWGGTSQPVYSALAALNANLIRPSLFGYQAMSRNSGLLNNGLEFLLADGAATAQALLAAYGTRAFWNSPICEPSFDPANGGSATYTTAFTNLLTELRAVSATTGVPHVDGPGVLGQPGARWNYIPGVSDDNTHFNSIGAELEAPACRAVLAAFLGAA